MESHLLQMRGLKLKEETGCTEMKWSHLLQMRGLKPFIPLPRSIRECRIFYRCVD